MFRTWNMRFLDLWQQSFHPVCQNCILLVYMISLRIVGIRSDITWRETFFEPWRKNFELFLKTAFYVSNGTFWVKKNFFESSDFFSNSSKLWTNLYCAWRESFRHGYQNWKRQFSSHKIKQKIKLSKSLFSFQNLQNFERTFTVLGEKDLGSGIKLENCTLCLQSIILSLKKNFWKFSKFSFISDLEHNCFGFEATEFSPGLSKMQSKCLYDFSSNCWY